MASLLKSISGDYTTYTGITGSNLDGYSVTIRTANYNGLDVHAIQPASMCGTETPTSLCAQLDLLT